MTIGLTNFRKHFLLVGNVGFDGIGDEKIRASPLVFAINTL